MSHKSELYGNMEGRSVLGWEHFGGLVTHRALPRKLWVPGLCQPLAGTRDRWQREELGCLVLGHSGPPR